MKGEVIFSVLVILVLSGFASAACDSSQTIVNFSSSTNAHARFYSATAGGGTYPYSICFNEKFSISSSSATRTCTGANGVIGLSALTNAHVENVMFTNYTNDVCYGNLECNLRVGTGGNVPCIGEEANMFSISSLSNAHAAKIGDYVFTLCCSAPGYTPRCNNDGICDSEDGETSDNCCDCVDVPNFHCNYNSNAVIPNGIAINSVYWSNGSISAGILEVINNSYVNNSAYLVSNVPSGTSDGTRVYFRIYENDGATSTNVKNLTGNVKNGKAYVEWSITDADIATGISGDSDGNEEFYFNASSGAFSNLSSLLYVKNINGPNVAPVANISSPADDSVYFIGENITFKSGSFDRDGKVNIQWDIGDSITGVEKSSGSFNHSYNTTGDKVVILTATDNDGAVTTTRVVITIVAQGINIHAKINKPYQGEDIFNYTIAYSGSGSWVININTTKGAICIGGSCPLTIPSAIPPTVTQTNRSYDSMNFSWTYGGDNFLINSQGGLASVTGARTYGSVGAKSIVLNVSYNGISSRIYNNFTINEPSGCTVDGLFFVDSSKTRWSTILAPNVCNMNPICCPRTGDYSCNLVSGVYTCQSGTCNSFFTSSGGGTAEITLCDHYNNVTGNKTAQCIADCAGARRSAQELNFIRNTYGIGTGYQINNIECVWNNDKCDVAFTSVSNGGTVAAPVEIFSGCRETIISQSECTADNYQVINWKSESIVSSLANDAVCLKSGTHTVLCGTPVIALSFFTKGNLIATVIIIILIYLIISYSKGKKQAKDKGKKRK